MASMHNFLIITILMNELGIVHEEPCYNINIKMRHV